MKKYVMTKENIIDELKSNLENRKVRKELISKIDFENMLSDINAIMDTHLATVSRLMNASKMYNCFNENLEFKLVKLERALNLKLLQIRAHYYMDACSDNRNLYDEFNEWYKNGLSAIDNHIAHTHNIVFEDRKEYAG